MPSSEIAGEACSSCLPVAWEAGEEGRVEMRSPVTVAVRGMAGIETQTAASRFWERRGFEIFVRRRHMAKRSSFPRQERAGKGR
jgi:hypothetical protein